MKIHLPAAPAAAENPRSPGTQPEKAKCNRVVQAIQIHEEISFRDTPAGRQCANCRRTLADVPEQRGTPD